MDRGGLLNLIEEAAEEIWQGREGKAGVALINQEISGEAEAHQPNLGWGAGQLVWRLKLITLAGPC